MTWGDWGVAWGRLGVTGGWLGGDLGANELKKNTRVKAEAQTKHKKHSWPRQLHLVVVETQLASLASMSVHWRAR